MRTIKILFCCHIAALLFGLGGLLIALPHPELWAGNPFAVEVFNFGIHYAGSLHIVFGAAAVLLFGLVTAGARKTLIFFVVATLIPLGIELLGTSTGFPFGAYAYTSFLGFKVAGLVPYSIPLSWFYMGFTSFLLANAIVAGLGARHRTAWSLALGVYFLTVWDLSLDPAMASQRLLVHFWLWGQPGPYFGMPISNLVGWSVTGLIYMGIARLLWRSNLDVRRIAVWFPFGVYVANTGFAIALNVSVGLWIPVVMAVVLGLVPASLALVLRPAREELQSDGSGTRTGGQGAREGRPYPVRKEGTRVSVGTRVSLVVVDRGCRALMRGKAQVMVEGLEHVPGSGPVMIVARHFHHLYDGCALLGAVPRRLHILVALDWVRGSRLRWLMEWACAMVDWPVMLRGELLREETGGEHGAYTRSESGSYLRRAVKSSVRILRDDEALIVFPEAYPTIDPAPTPKQGEDAFLPFRPGFAKLVEMAERDGRTRVAIVPAGFVYVQGERWHVTLRFGPPLFRKDYADASSLVRAVEERVRDLSGQSISSASGSTQEVVQL